MATIPLSRPQDTPTTTGPRASWLARRPLLVYAALAYALSWLILVPAALGVIPESAGAILAWLPPFGPAVAALIVTALTGGRSAVGRLLRRCVRWRVGVRWYLLVIVGVPLIELLGAFAVLGRVPLGDLARNWPVLFTGYPIYLVYIAITTGLGEEPGWRGFALPRLQRRHGPLAGTAVLAVVWALWHLPNVLFGGWTGRSFGLWLATTVATAFVYTWVYNRTGGSVLIAALLHGAINGSSGVVTGLLPDFNDAVNVPLYTADAIAFTIVALALVAATRGRLGYRPGDPAAAADADGPTGQRLAAADQTAR